MEFEPLYRADKQLSESDMRFLVECVWPVSSGAAVGRLGDPKVIITHVDGVRVKLCECGADISDTKRRCCEACRIDRRRETYRRYFYKNQEARVGAQRARRAAA